MIIESKRGYIGNLLMMIAISFPILIVLELLVFKSWAITIGFMGVFLAAYFGEKRVVRLALSPDFLEITYYHWAIRKSASLPLDAVNPEVLLYKTIMGKYHQLNIRTTAEPEYSIISREGFKPDDFMIVAQLAHEARTKTD